MSRASIAVIVPVLDEVGSLGSLLPRIDALGADETIIVDGGSQDGSVAMLRQAAERGRLRMLVTSSGRARQMNAGAGLAESDIFLFLHADMEISSSHIEDVRRAMRDSSVVGGRFDVRLSGSHPAFRIIEFFINLRSRWTRISTGDQAMFVRRDVFDRLGGFADQPLMEDIELSRRLKRAGRIACLRRKVVTSSRRWERHGIARTILLMWRLRFLYACGVSADRLATHYRQAR